VLRTENQNGDVQVVGLRRLTNEFRLRGLRPLREHRRKALLAAGSDAR